MDRRVTVLRTYPQQRIRRSWEAPRSVPLVIFSGERLAALGFEEGKAVLVEARRERLVLTLVEPVRRDHRRQAGS